MPQNDEPRDVEITSDEEFDKYFDEIRRADWVLVPAEPTTAMRAAGARANYPLHSIDITDEVYRVMLAARPR
jgi:hypothetical protein